MDVFLERLREWLRVSREFPEHNPLQWIEVQTRLFPIAAPTRAVWKQTADILSILNVLGETSNLNHLFFPDGGGLDLERAVRSPREHGCIELITDGLANIVRPVRLFFEAFHDDPEWNYFRLETGALEPSGLYSGIQERRLHEELTDVGREFYADRSCWDSGEYDGRRLPKGSRVVSRYFHGSFVIFQKTSTYNRTSETYDARHNKMTADEFRRHISRAVEHSKKHR